MAVSSQDIVNFLLANPGMSDAQIVAAMEQYGVSPAQMANAVGLDEGVVAARVAATIPPNQSIQLGDTIVQPVYSQTGSGMDAQIGPIENVITYKADENKVGGGYTQYTPTGEVERTGTQQKVASFTGGLVEAFKDPVVLAALGGAAYGGLFGGAGTAAGAAGTAGMSAAELAQLDLALGGAGGTAGATSLGNALATGANVGTLTNLTGGSGLLTGAAGGITADSVAAKLAADAGTQGLITGGAGNVGGAGGAGTVGGVGGAGTVGGTGGGTGGGAGGGAGTSTLGGAGTGVLTNVGTNVGTGLLTKSLADTISGVSQTAGSLLQSQTSKEAAQKAASDIAKATQTAQEAAQFRPVGMTTRFGTSNYTYDPVTGRMTSAGYQLSPEAKAAQDRLVGLAGRGLTQAEQAQQQFAPLQTGAQSLFGLGNQYISQSPQDVAQNYLNQQMALLQPGRELELANLQNRLQQQGRAGLSVAQGGTLGATTPELQALYNARAQQEAQLAANAQQFGQQNVLFGAGLLGQGTNALNQYYGGQVAAYQPYQAAMGQVQNLESLGQQPLQIGATLGQQSSAAGARAGQLGLTGQQLASGYSTGANATYNPYAGLLTAAGNPNAMFGQSVASAFAPGGMVDRYLYPSGNPLQTGALSDPGLWT